MTTNHESFKRIHEATAALAAAVVAAEADTLALIGATTVARRDYDEVNAERAELLGDTREAIADLREAFVGSPFVVTLDEDASLLEVVRFASSVVSVLQRKMNRSRVAFFDDDIRDTWCAPGQPVAPAEVVDDGDVPF